MHQPPLPHTKFYKNWSYDLSFQRIFKILVPKFLEDYVSSTKKAKIIFWLVKGTATGRKSHNYDFFTIFCQILVIFKAFNIGGFNFLYIYIYIFRLNDFLKNFGTKNMKILRKLSYTINFPKTLCVEGGLGHMGKHRKWILYALII